MENFCIETERLILRPFRVEDAKEYFYLTQDEDIKKFVNYACQDSIREAKLAISDCYSKCDFKNDFYLIIERKEDKTIVGCFIITKTFDMKAYDVCYLIGKAFRHNGYITEALHGIFEKLPFDFSKNLEFYVHVENQASLNVLKKLPVTQEKDYKSPYFNLFYFHKN